METILITFLLHSYDTLITFCLHPDPIRSDTYSLSVITYIKPAAGYWYFGMPVQMPVS